jgi:hypothetical protein
MGVAGGLFSVPAQLWGFFAAVYGFRASLIGAGEWRTSDVVRATSESEILWAIPIAFAIGVVSIFASVWRDLPAERAKLAAVVPSLLVVAGLCAFINFDIHVGAYIAMYLAAGAASLLLVWRPVRGLELDAESRSVVMAIGLALLAAAGVASSVNQWIELSTVVAIALGLGWLAFHWAERRPLLLGLASVVTAYAVSLVARTITLQLDGVDGDRTVYLATAATFVAMLAATAFLEDTKERRVLSGLSIAGAILLLATSPDITALTIVTLMFAAVSLACAVRPGRGNWLFGFAAFGELALLAQLGNREVVAVEWYSLSTAALLLAVGLLGWKFDSWKNPTLVLGPALLVGFVPSTLVVLGGGGTLRFVLLAGAAVGVTAAGAVFCTRVLMTVGGAVLLTLTVDLLAPYAVDLPNWVTLGIGGATMLSFGAYAERRARQRRLKDEAEAVSTGTN